MNDSRKTYPSSKSNASSDFGTDRAQTLLGHGQFGAHGDSGPPADLYPQPPLDETNRELKYAYGSEYEETNKVHSKRHLSPFRR